MLWMQQGRTNQNLMSSKQKGPKAISVQEKIYDGISA